MDLYDDPNNPVVTATLELPGMQPDQLSLRIEDNKLIVEGEREGPRLHLGDPGVATTLAPSSSVPNADATADSVIATLYPIHEVKYGKFRRDINLPPGVMVSLM